MYEVMKKKKDTDKTSKEDLSQDDFKPFDVPIIYIHNTKDSTKTNTDRHGE